MSCPRGEGFSPVGLGFALRLEALSCEIAPFSFIKLNLSGNRLVLPAPRQGVGRHSWIYQRGSSGRTVLSSAGINDLTKLEQILSSFIGHILGLVCNSSRLAVWRIFVWQFGGVSLGSLA